MRLNTVFFGLSVAALLILVYPWQVDAGDRRWITNERGETVGYIEAAPLSDSRLVLRDREGQAVGVIERKELEDDYVIRDRDGNGLGRLEGEQDQGSESRDPRYWRDGPRKEWGSYEDRW
jgi:hypothetical protein